MRNGRVLVIGLDGAGWPVLEPLLASGRLPFLKELLAKSAWGDLVSPWPGSTFPSWTSIVTGVDPDLHGMVDFTILDPPTYSLRFIDARARRVPAVWEYAHWAGRVGVALGVPGTYPPDRAVTLMVSGFDTPVTTRIESSFVHPPSWREKLARLGGFPLTPVGELRLGPHWHAHAWEALRGSIEGKVRATEAILRDLQPDFCMLVFGESDTVSHHFWVFADEGSPRRVPSMDGRFSNALADVYTRLDGAMAHIASAMGPHGLLLVVSDHGFGGAGVQALYLNRFLASHGFLRFGDSRSHAAVGHLAFRAAAGLPPRVQQWMFRRGKGLVGRIETRRRLGGISWGATLAYSEELPYAPGVRINLLGREGRGTVTRAHYDRTRDEVRAALEGWRDAETGDPVVRKVYLREEVAPGPAGEFLPDLLIDLATPGGYSYVVSSSNGRDGPVQERLDPSVLGAKGSGLGGTHRRLGLFVAHGEGVIPGRIAEPIHASQLAAAMLACLGVDAPSFMSAPPPFLPQPTWSERAPCDSQRLPDHPDGWEWARLKRLRALGYLD